MNYNGKKKRKKKFDRVSSKEKEEKEADLIMSRKVSTQRRIWTHKLLFCKDIFVQ